MRTVKKPQAPRCPVCNGLGMRLEPFGLSAVWVPCPECSPRAA